ncbi:MAG TPA: elongation factor G [Candidatus Edwardsbacteria bacterium]|nr:elongation factor G [Candidatus Edwardsbacteria bacterium]
MKSYTADKIINLVLAGHGGSGKTTLAEAMMHLVRPTERLGRVDDGNALFDFDPDETARKISIFSALAACEYGDRKITIIDTPGYADFAGEVKAAVRVADAALLVAQAVAGIEVGTDKAWKYANEMGLPRGIVITKLKKEHADFYKTLEQAQDMFGHQCVALTIPLGDQLGVKGVADLSTMKAHFEGGKEGEIPAEAADKAKTYRERMVESVAEADDALMEKYLGGEALSEQEISDGLKAGIAAGKLVPVFAADGHGEIGVKAIMNCLAASFPTAARLPEVTARKAGADAEVQVKCDPAGPPLLFIFKTFIEPHAGNLNFFRVYSGTIETGMDLYNANKSKSEKMGQLYFPLGKERVDAGKVSAGDIGIAVKLKESGTNDTLGLKANPLLLAPIALPKPSISEAVETKSKDDEGKIGVGLSKLRDEDPTFGWAFVPEVRQTQVFGLGELHLDIMMGRLKRKYNVEVLRSKPRIAYRETITRTVENAEYKHKKQTGGHGQYGHVVLRLEPRQRGEGFEFEDAIVGGVVPNNFIPSVEKGIRAGLIEGAVAGYHIVDIKAVLHFGSYHDVDSSGTSFEIAASQALKKGMLEAGPVLLEPITKLEVVIPDEFAGQVMGDLNSRRGRISGMDSEKGLQIIKATVPEAELYKYSTSLRSITQGRGDFTAEFSHYEEVPYEIAQKIIAESKKEKEEKQK